MNLPTPNEHLANDGPALVRLLDAAQADLTLNLVLAVDRAHLGPSSVIAFAKQGRALEHSDDDQRLYLMMPSDELREWFLRQPLPMTSRTQLVPIFTSRGPDVVRVLYWLGPVLSFTSAKVETLRADAARRASDKLTVKIGTRRNEN